MNKQIRPTVYKILQEDKLARSDDNYLILKVVQELEPELAGEAFINVMTKLKYKKISLEGITKAKKEFLETYPNLYEDEIWKDIKGFEGIYKVSNYGRIKSIIRYKKMMKTALDRSGYLKICLTDSKHKKHTIKIHRLVAENFIPNTENKEQVNHIDGNKENNRVDNLEWCSQSENMIHAFKNNLIHRGKGKESPRARAVNQYSLDGKFIKRWDCIADAERELKLSKNNISTCCKGKRKTAHGFKWEYFEEYPQYKELDVENARRKEEEEYFIEYGNHVPRLD